MAQIKWVRDCTGLAKRLQRNVTQKYTAQRTFPNGISLVEKRRSQHRCEIKQRLIPCKHHLATGARRHGRKAHWRQHAVVGLLADRIVDHLDVIELVSP